MAHLHPQMDEITALAEHYVLYKLQNMLPQNPVDYYSITAKYAFSFLHILFIICNFLIVINIILWLLYYTIKAILWIIDLFYYIYTGYHITL
jgi:hypothetical protein